MMIITLEVTYAELCTILAALRTAQEHYAAFRQMPHFEDVDPLTENEIDKLAEHINAQT